MGLRGVELGTKRGWRESRACRGQRLGGGTALRALPKRSPAEAEGRRREGDWEKNIVHQQHA